MAASARKQETAASAAPERWIAPALPSAELVTDAALHTPLPSPAHAIQARLQDALDQTGFAEPEVEKWAPGKALAMMIGASLGLWAVLGIGLYLILR